MKSLFYILNEKREVENVQEGDEGLLRWGRFYSQKDKLRVAHDLVGKTEVSTVFLAVDYGLSDEPLLWETKIFGGPFDEWTDRCSGSWQDAEAMHARMVAKVSTPPTTGEQVADKFQ